MVKIYKIGNKKGKLSVKKVKCTNGESIYGYKYNKVEIIELGDKGRGTSTEEIIKKVLTVAKCTGIKYVKVIDGENSKGNRYIIINY